MKPNATAVADELRNGEDGNGLTDAEECHQHGEQNGCSAESGDARERGGDKRNESENEPAEDVRHGSTLTARAKIP